MSGILLLHNSDGSEVNREVFNKMFSSLEHRGSDGSNIEYLNNTALGHHHFWTTPEEIDVIQPVKISSGDFYILFDGRLDNRHDLFKLIDINDRAIPDAKLILELYSRFGTEFFKELLGSYVFVIYDNIKNKIITVRDHLGDKILYYYYDSNKFVLASEPISILRHPEITLEINDKKIAEYFALHEQTENSSFFKNIYELLPAHYLIYGKSGIKAQRYWDFDPYKKIRYKDEEQYFEHFRSIFQKSVECRLRTVGDPGVMMSGGFDSTSIVAYANNLRKNGKIIKTFSYVFDEFKESDERRYIDDFCQMHKVENIKVNGDDCWPLNNFNSWHVSPNFPNLSPYQGLKVKLFDSVNKNNIRTLLIGWYADQLFTGADYWLKDYITDFKLFRAALGTVKLINSVGIKNIGKNKSLRILLRPLKYLRDFIKTETAPEAEYPFLTHKLRSLLPEGFYWSEFTRNYYRSAQAIQVAGLNTAFDASACEYCCNGTLLDFRYPFRDRRIVEFFFQIPSYLMHDDTGYKDKYIIRNALRNQLPPSILNREEITSINNLLYHGLMDKNIDLIRNIIKENSCKIDSYIHLDKLNEVLYRGSKELNNSDFYLLWNSLCLVLWKKKLLEYSSVRV